MQHGGLPSCVFSPGPTVKPAMHRDVGWVLGRRKPASVTVPAHGRMAPTRFGMVGACRKLGVSEVGLHSAAWRDGRGCHVQENAECGALFQSEQGVEPDDRTVGRSDDGARRRLCGGTFRLSIVSPMSKQPTGPPDLSMSKVEGNSLSGLPLWEVRHGPETDSLTPRGSCEAANGPVWTSDMGIHGLNMGLSRMVRPMRRALFAVTHRLVARTSGRRNQDILFLDPEAQTTAASNERLHLFCLPPQTRNPHRLVVNQTNTRGQGGA